MGYPADNRPDEADPGSAGYGAGGKVELPTHTGGNQIPSQDDVPPGSGGFGVGGEVDLPSSIGGSRIDESGGWSTTTPGDPVSGLGNVYNTDKPALVTNPKHVPGGEGFRPNAGIQPPDYAEAYQGAVKVDGAWWGVSADGKSIYRYFESGDGTVHWAGSTGDERNPLTQKVVPSEVLKTFGFKAKGSKSPW